MPGPGRSRLFPAALMFASATAVTAKAPSSCRSSSRTRQRFPHRSPVRTTSGFSPAAPQRERGPDSLHPTVDSWILSSGRNGTSVGGDEMFGNRHWVIGLAGIIVLIGRAAVAQEMPRRQVSGIYPHLAM